MRFGVIANLNRPGAAEAIQNTIKWTSDNGHDLILCDELSEAANGSAKFAPRNELAHRVEMLVSMGGDGTLLSSARAVGDAGTPLLGINLGSLGFLTQQEAPQLIPALEAVAGGKFKIDSRMVLKVEIPGQSPLDDAFALNDVVVDRGSVSRVIDITLRANGEEVVTYTADGLIIATPTGSTAYSLAVGGPILHPGLQAMVASPISAFSLTTRPMIFSAADTIELAIRTQGREAMLSLDGQVMIELQDGQVVRISKADFQICLVQLPENSYYRLLRRKLNWGIPPAP